MLRCQMGGLVDQLECQSLTLVSEIVHCTERTKFNHKNYKAGQSSFWLLKVPDPLVTVSSTHYSARSVRA
jgi:hypothetical protein